MAGSLFAASTSQSEEKRRQPTLFPAFGAAASAAASPSFCTTAAASGGEWLRNKSFDVKVTPAPEQAGRAGRESTPSSGHGSDALRADERRLTNEGGDGERKLTSRRMEAKEFDTKSFPHIDTLRDSLDRVRRVTEDTERGETGGSDESNKKGRSTKKKKKKSHHRHHLDSRHRSSHHHHDAHHTQEQRSPCTLQASRQVSSVSAADDSRLLISGKIFLEDMQGLAPEHAYRLDKACDPNNVTYDSLYKLHVARLRRAINSPLGLCNGQWLQLAPPGRKNRKRKGLDDYSAGRYFSKDAAAACRTDGETIGQPDSKVDTAQLTTSTGYVPLLPLMKDSAGISPADCHGSSALVYDHATRLYSLGLGLPEREASDASAERPESLRRTADYNGRLRENPSDVDLWLEFVTYQDVTCGVTEEAESIQAIAASSSEERRLGSSKKHSALFERKLAILDKALAANPASVLLKAARLRLGQQLWDRERVEAEWLSALHVHVNDASLWHEHLRHCRSGPLSDFQHTKVEAAYEKCLKSLRAVLCGDIKSHPCLPGTAEHMLDIFIEYCYYLRQIGYTERAVALFQAMIEFNCFAPVEPSNRQGAGALKEFRDFWRLKAPCFGENGAAGWCLWKGNNDAYQPMRLLAHEETEEEEKALAPFASPVAELGTVDCPQEGKAGSSQTARLSRAWLTLECLRERLHWLPWKPCSGEDDQSCEDQFRQVAAEDIMSSLFRLQTSKEQRKLCHAFLDFLGVCASDDATTEKGCCQMFAADNPESLGLKLPAADGLGLDSWPRGHRHLEEDFVKNCLLQLEGSRPFDSAEALSALVIRDIRQWVRCARRVVEAQPAGGCDESLPRSGALASEGRKLKQLLKDKLRSLACSNDSAVMCTYGDAERALGNDAASLRVYNAVLAVEQQRQQADASRLSTAAALALASYVRAECHQSSSEGSVSSAADRVQRMLGNFALGTIEASSSPTAPLLLRAMSILRTAAEEEAAALRSSAEASADNAQRETLCRYAALAFCSVALESLVTSDPQRVGSAAVVGVSLLAREKRYRGGRSWSGAALRFVLDCVDLLHLHRRRGAMGALRCLRQTLELAIAAFPQCTYLLHSYIDLERKVHVVGRARRLFSSVARIASLTEDKMLLYCMSVYFELLRCHDVQAATGMQTAGCASEYVRALGAEVDISFGAAGRHLATELEPSILFWRLCLLHEVLYGSKEMAMSVFYRALQHVPWAKALYMDAIKYFPEQLQDLLRLMEEKGVRTRISTTEELEMLLEMTALRTKELSDCS